MIAYIHPSIHPLVGNFTKSFILNSLFLIYGRKFITLKVANIFKKEKRKKKGF